MPLFSPIYIGLGAGTFEKIQLYSNGARRKYETLDEELMKDGVGRYTQMVIDERTNKLMQTM